MRHDRCVQGASLRRSLLLSVLVLGSCGEPERGPDPGRVTLHRLNATEYDNTVRDLFLTDLRPGRSFPDDDFGYGFDNIADTLSLSPLHLEIAESASRDLVNRAVLPGLADQGRWRVEAESEGATATSGGASGEGWNLWSNGALSAGLNLPGPGLYNLSTRVKGQQAGPGVVQMALGLDGVERETFEVEGDEWQEVNLQLNVPSGYHAFSVHFLNDWYEEGVGDRNLLVDWIDVEGPLDAEAVAPPGYDEVFRCNIDLMPEDECVAYILRNFGPRVWRRPLTADERARLTGLYALGRSEGLDFEPAVGLMVQAMLMSPHFLFRVEIDDDPASLVPHDLSAWELASRVSYFLWSSMPDDELFYAASDGSLLDDAVLNAQIERMLADPKAEALVDTLASQWLFIRAVDDTEPDYAAFPEFDEVLRHSMQEEMRRNVSEVMLGGGDMRALLTQRSTWIDARLAEHYGFAEPAEGWEKVSLDGTDRQGVLTTAGWLTALSYPTRTSPTRRGAWVLANLLCEEPPPPPADIPGLMEEAAEGEEPASVAALLEKHRADPTCRSCHQLMDPIGLGLENFDGVGRYRETDAGEPIEAQGSLPDGRAFDSARALSDLLAEDARFDRCVVQ